MELVILPEMQKGDWRITHFTVDRLCFRAALSGRAVPLGGKYTRLTRRGMLVMSDTPAEQRDHNEAVRRATGSCLINGLGIGMVLKNILLKKEVTDITVVEISQDLIDLVSPYYTDPRIEFVCTDAFKFMPPKGKRYNMVWHDIWNYICSDNIPEMTKLHRKYGRCSDWQGSWCKNECKRLL